MKIRTPLSSLDSELIYSLSRRKVLVALTAVIILLVIASTVGQISRFYFGHDHVFGLVPLFRLDAEGNVPTLFSVVLMLIASGLLALIALGKHRSGRRFALHWTAMSVIFLYLAFDEGAGIHELSVDPLRSTLGISGDVLRGTWVVLGIAFVLIFMLAYLKFLRSLARRYQRLFVLAGAIYVGGAIGMEVLGGWYIAALGSENLGYEMLATAEEALEMFGIVLFIYSLLAYMGDPHESLEVRIEGTSA